MGGRRESQEYSVHLREPVHAAATATEERTVFVAPMAGRIRAVTVTSDIAVTGDNTNTTNMNIINKGAAGVGTTEIGNLDLTTGVNMVAFDEKNIPITATALAEGDTVTLQFEKVGTGVAIGPSMVTIDWEPL